MQFRVLVQMLNEVECLSTSIEATFKPARWCAVSDHARVVHQECRLLLSLLEFTILARGRLSLLQYVCDLLHYLRGVDVLKVGIELHNKKRLFVQPTQPAQNVSCWCQIEGFIPRLDEHFKWRMRNSKFFSNLNKERRKKSLLESKIWRAALLSQGGWNWWCGRLQGPKRFWRWFRRGRSHPFLSSSLLWKLTSFYSSVFR